MSVYSGLAFFYLYNTVEEEEEVEPEKIPPRFNPTSGCILRHPIQSFQSYTREYSSAVDREMANEKFIQKSPKMTTRLRIGSLIMRHHTGCRFAFKAVNLVQARFFLKSPSLAGSTLMDARATATAAVGGCRSWLVKWHNYSAGNMKCAANLPHNIFHAKWGFMPKLLRFPN